MNVIKYGFNKLNPSIIKQDETYAVYKNSLDLVYQDNEIKNIAITGIYGAGKSSLWNTYRQDKKELGDCDWQNEKIITVALSNFQEVAKYISNNQECGDDNDTSSVERQIINQILYQINPEKIPLCKYDIKLPKTKIQLIKEILLFLSFFVGTIALYIKDDIVQPLSPIMSPLTVVIISGFLIVVPAIVLLKCMLRKTKIKLTKVNIKGMPIPLMEDEDINVLNHNMRELVYIIVASGVKTVVFEDLDRFESTNLFVKLRELNYLINFKSKHDIKFIYMLRDGLFESKERTKFFDYILPIVPIINAQNSKGMILKLFSYIEDPLSKPTPQLLERISIYTDDMRMLYSIRNEYEIYSNAIDLKKRELQADKLVSLLVLKNIFPQEYDLLQQDQGYIYNLFLEADKDKKNQLSTIKAEIIKIQNSIITLEESKEIQDPGKLADGVSEEDQIEMLGENIVILNKNYEEVALMNISMLLKGKTSDELDIFFGVNKSTDKILCSHYFPLIRFLLIDGWVDETYCYYKGYFHQSSMGLNDEIFMRKLLDGTASDESFHLDNPNVIASKLLDSDYERFGAFNFDLLTELINTCSKNTLWRIIRNVLNSEKSGSLIGFINELDNRNLEKFVLILIEEHFVLLWGLYINQNNLDELNYKLSQILYSNFELIPCKVNQLNNFISKKSEILEKSYTQNNDDFLNGLQLAKVSFVDISNISINKELAIKLEELALFDLSIYNIRKLIDCILGGDSEENLCRLFSFLYKEDCFSVTKERVDNQLETIVNQFTEILCSEDTNAETGEKTLLYILNRDISEETKIKLIDIEATPISLLEDVNDSTLWDNIIEHSLLEYSEININKYWEVFQCTSIIISYLNNYYKLETKITIPEELADILINSSEISSSGFYDSLLQSSLMLDNLNDRLSNERIDLLIENKRLNLTVYNLKHILNLNVPKLLCKYTAQYKSEFVQFVLDNSLIEQFSEMNIIGIINENVLENDNIKTLLSMNNKKVSLFSVDTANHEIRRFIINDFFEVDDIERIMDLQESFDLWIEFLTLLYSNSEIYSKSKNYQWPYKYVDKILSSEVIGTDRKVDIIAYIIQRKLFISNISKWMNSISEIVNIARVFDNKHPKIEGDYQRIISEALESIGVVSISSNMALNFKKSEFNKLI